MKYMKCFESSAYDADPKIRKWRNNIIKTIVSYCRDYEDRKVWEFEKSFIWEYEDVNNRFNNITDAIDEECVSMVIDNVLQDVDRIKDKFLEFYYDILDINKGKEDLSDTLNEIFADYIDDETLKVKINKSSDKGDDRYQISINSRSNEDVLTKISFNEVINRVRDIGLPHLHYQGTNEWIKLEFWRELDKFENKD